MRPAREKVLEEVRLELRKLHCEGRLLAQDVVEAARNKASVLHGFFDWDDSSAAEKYRLDQARDLIASVRVDLTVNHKVLSSIGYAHDPSLPQNVAGYVEVQALRNKPAQARALMRLEVGYLEAILTRAESLAVVLGLSDDIAAVAKRVAKFKKKVG